VISLGASVMQPRQKHDAITTVRFRSSPEQKQTQPARQKESRQDARLAETGPPSSSEPAKAIPVVPNAQPKPPAEIIRLSPNQMADADLAKLPRSPAAPGPKRPVMGPANPGPMSGDSARVSGSGPQGEPLYAAAWYREPYPDELQGYLSTATGPGWGLIACRTAPDFRVEDCVKIDEYPDGSNIARAVLAAAWQFKVRPPRIGGQPKIGEWVRIRIDYDLRRR
jgi:protein TonB